MSWPTKILPFRKIYQWAAIEEAIAAADEFPRFHKEQLRPHLAGRPLAMGSALPPPVEP